MTEKKLVDPLKGHVYTGTDEGLVEVLDPETGQRGIFEESGKWVSGELTYANRQLTGWVGRAVRDRRVTPEEPTPTDSQEV